MTDNVELPLADKSEQKFREILSISSTTPWYDFITLVDELDDEDWEFLARNIPDDTDAGKKLAGVLLSSRNEARQEQAADILFERNSLVFDSRYAFHNLGYKENHVSVRLLERYPDDYTMIFDVLNLLFRYYPLTPEQRPDNLDALIWEAYKKMNTPQHAKDMVELIEENGYTPVWVLDDYVHSLNGEIPYNTCERILRSEISGESISLIHANYNGAGNRDFYELITSNPNTLASTLESIYRTQKDTDILFLIIRNPNTPLRILEENLTHPYPRVRAFLSKNTNLPDKALLHLMKDENKNVAGIALSTFYEKTFKDEGYPLEWVEAEYGVTAVDWYEYLRSGQK